MVSDITFMVSEKMVSEKIATFMPLKARTFLKILMTVITKITMTENEVGFYTYIW